jgi:hypothetical protein
MSAADVNTLPFGRHAGKTLQQIIAADRGYACYLMGQPAFFRKHHALYVELRALLVAELAAEGWDLV